VLTAYCTGLAGSTSVGHVLHAIRVRTCHASSGYAAPRCALACVRGSHGAVLHSEVFTVLREYSHWSFAPSPGTCDSVRCRAVGTARLSGANRSVVGLVWHYWALTEGYSWGTPRPSWVVCELDRRSTPSWYGRATAAVHMYAGRIRLCGVSMGTSQTSRGTHVVPSCPPRNRKEAPLVCAPGAPRRMGCRITPLAPYAFARVQLRRHPFRPTSATPTRRRSRRQCCRRFLAVRATRIPHRPAAVRLPDGCHGCAASHGCSVRRCACGSARL
jgi:hypothetical protein